jgi:acetyl esterase/lipase
MAGAPLDHAPRFKTQTKDTERPMTDTREFDPIDLVDPGLRAAALGLPAIPLNADILPGIRAVQRVIAPVLPAPAPQPVEQIIPGHRNGPDVRIVLVQPQGQAEGRPAYLHMHGGGFVLGAANATEARRIQDIAMRHDCVVVSVDYRLAPETRFPGALDDNYAALRWLHAHAEELGVDPARIAIGGESAGGGHAAMLAIAARDRGEFEIAFQLLLYPMLDDRTASTRQPPPHVGRYLWGAEANRFGWTSLLGVDAGSPDAPAGSVPARVEDLRGLPPAELPNGPIPRTPA